MSRAIVCRIMLCAEEEEDDEEGGGFDSDGLGAIYRVSRTFSSLVDRGQRRNIGLGFGGWGGLVKRQHVFFHTFPS